MKKYYLSSMDSRLLENVRECEYIKTVHFNTGKEAEVVKIDNPLVWSNDEGNHESFYAIITARHEGFGIIDIKSFPTFVYVTVLKNSEYDEIEEVSNEDLIIIGIGEIYETYEKAQKHIFD